MPEQDTAFPLEDPLLRRIPHITNRLLLEHIINLATLDLHILAIRSPALHPVREEYLTMAHIHLQDNLATQLPPRVMDHTPKRLSDMRHASLQSPYEYTQLNRKPLQHMVIELSPSLAWKDRQYRMTCDLLVTRRVLRLQYQNTCLPPHLLPATTYRFIITLLIRMHLITHIINIAKAIIPSRCRERRQSCIQHYYQE